MRRPDVPLECPAFLFVICSVKALLKEMRFLSFLGKRVLSDEAASIAVLGVHFAKIVFLEFHF
ncbi:hypothetical protein ATPR_3034 [Acetobacter tropicalis NBRC 101654]|uniref:Uncharacterized protein n=1 Tax=Acetobacter tropicalis NBRC 101654 TaxID=749388 RepID=F7VI35_9PROT|nr:hypothetical protein ATPR_3034 [Acetobacter tropicalis NBRC 101654]